MLMQLMRCFVAQFILLYLPFFVIVLIMFLLLKVLVSLR